MGMTDTDIIDQLRKFFEIKGWPVLREAADRLEQLSTLHESTFVRPACPVCHDTFGKCNQCGGRSL